MYKINLNKLLHHIFNNFYELVILILKLIIMYWVFRGG